MEETPRTTCAELEENKTGIQNIKCRNLNDKTLNRTKTQDQEKMKITMNSNRSYKIVTKKIYLFKSMNRSCDIYSMSSRNL